MNSLKDGASCIFFITYPPFLYFGKDIANLSVPNLVLASFLLEFSLKCIAASSVLYIMI